MSLSYRKIKKIILEEIKKSLLLEVSFEQAKQNLDSKKFIKVIKAYNFEKSGNPEENLEELHKNLKQYVIGLIPDDIQDSEKGVALLWVISNLKKMGLEQFSFLLEQPSYYDNIKSSLEIFFHWKNFMSEKDLNKISISEIIEVANKAKPKIEEYQEKKKYNDAKEGTEVLLDNESWFIAIIHNKGAACELGKGTDWCTAAPGLNYFEQYYKPEDPLFYFEDKNSGEKYQFHYGSGHFMDKNDRQVSRKIKDFLEDLLIYETEVYKKNEITRKILFGKRHMKISYKLLFHLKRMIQRMIKDVTKESVDAKRNLFTLKEFIKEFPYILKYKNSFIVNSIFNRIDFFFSSRGIEQIQELIFKEIEEYKKFKNKFGSDIENEDILDFQELFQKVKDLLKHLESKIND